MGEKEKKGTGQSRSPGKQDICLATGTVIFCDSLGYGMKRRENSRYARDAVQTAILQELNRKENRKCVSLDALLETIGTRLPDATAPCMAALSLAAFVLDFEGYLEK